MPAASLSAFYKRTVLPNLGICLTLVSQLFNCMMIMFCKLLITDPDFETPLHPLQILFVRMSITYLFCVIYFVFIEKNKDFPLGPKGYRLLLLLRAAGGFVGVGGQYWSLLYLNVSDTVCITFLSPTVTSLMAYIFLGERFTRVEAIGGLVAFGGVLLIARPHFLLELFSPSEAAEDITDTGAGGAAALPGRIIGTCFAFFSTFGTGVAMCSIRKIGFNAHPLFMVSIYALFTLVASFVGIILLPGLSFQIPHTTKQWSLLTAIGITGFFMQYLLTAGMQREKAARAIAMTYTQLVYASVFDYVVNGTIPAGWSLMGEMVIVLAVFSIVYFKNTTPTIITQDIESAPQVYGTPKHVEEILLEDYHDDDDDDDSDYKPSPHASASPTPSSSPKVDA